MSKLVQKHEMFSVKVILTHFYAFLEQIVEWNSYSELELTVDETLLDQIAIAKPI